MTRMAIPPFEEGAEFWNLTIERFLNPRLASCRCKCGTLVRVRRCQWAAGIKRSCGCVNYCGVHLKKHGGCSADSSRLMRQLHTRWQDIKKRCTNPKIKSYPDYGGRGIKISDKWLDFLTFYSDIVALPEMAGLEEIPPELSIDRIDNNGHYEPGNVRLATRAEQSRNTRNNVFVTINGETKIVKDWCRVYGISQSRVSNRIASGWPIEEAITTPKILCRKGRKHRNRRGNYRVIRDQSEKTTIS